MQPSNNYTADQYWNYIYFTNLHDQASLLLQQELARALYLQIQNSC